MSAERYDKLINTMAINLDCSNEMPSTDSDEFKQAVSELLSGDIRSDLPKLTEEIRLLATYFNNNDSFETKTIKAITICEALTSKISDYFREDIESDIELTHKRKYSRFTLYDSVDCIPHCG